MRAWRVECGESGTSARRRRHAGLCRRKTNMNGCRFTKVNESLHFTPVLASVDCEHQSEARGRKARRRRHGMHRNASIRVTECSGMHQFVRRGTPHFLNSLRPPVSSLQPSWSRDPTKPDGTRHLDATESNGLQRSTPRNATVCNGMRHPDEAHATECNAIQRLTGFRCDEMIRNDTE